VSQSRVRAIPEGMHTITPHIVVRDAARAAEWYIEALGAEERSRIPVPGDKLMSVELYVEDVDALWKRAVGAGAEVLHPLGDTFWGDRHGQITAPFGHRWGLAQHMRNVPPEEISRAAAEAFGG
jgi:PhnB protein